MRWWDDHVQSNVSWQLCKNSQTAQTRPWHRSWSAYKISLWLFTASQSGSTKRPSPVHSLYSALLFFASCFQVLALVHRPRPGHTNTRSTSILTLITCQYRTNLFKFKFKPRVLEIGRRFCNGSVSVSSGNVLDSWQYYLQLCMHCLPV